MVNSACLRRNHSDSFQTGFFFFLTKGFMFSPALLNVAASLLSFRQFVLNNVVCT